MRLPMLCAVFAAVGAAGGGCAPDTTGTGSILNLVAGATDSDAPMLQAAAAAAPAGTTSSIVGTVVATGDYQIFALGPTAPGDEWTVSADDLLSSRAFLVVLFNADNELLQREIVSARSPCEHIIRTSTNQLYVGVSPAYGGSGGDFRFTVGRRSDAVVPAPHQQVVWLNFDGAAAAVVHARSPISFTAFDAAVLGSAYAGATQTVKAAILETVREDYAPYNVVVLSSDDGPPPAGPYATLHFGGRDDRLLGLADNVDQYNTDPGQAAIIYVNTFSDFEVMGLTAEEMGQMVGNVSSHEFGHLLGLFHTRVPVDLMDTTGTAWDLAGEQNFSRAALEPSVFPFGLENSPSRLAETVGRKVGAKENDLAKPRASQKMLRKAGMRALARQALDGRCGTCLNLDD